MRPPHAAGQLLPSPRASPAPATPCPNRHQRTMVAGAGHVTVARGMPWFGFVAGGERRHYTPRWTWAVVHQATFSPGFHNMDNANADAPHPTKAPICVGFMLCSNMQLDGTFPGRRGQATLLTDGGLRAHWTPPHPCPVPTPPPPHTPTYYPFPTPYTPHPTLPATRTHHTHAPTHHTPTPHTHTTPTPHLPHLPHCPAPPTLYRQDPHLPPPTHLHPPLATPTPHTPHPHLHPVPK